MEGIHFLRPLWLVALPLAALLVVVLRRLGDPRRAWRGVIAPHLLDALLLVDHRRRGPGPVHFAGLAWVVSIIALAGPAWQREPSPFAEDTAALVVVIEVAPSMESKDVQPSRLARAAQKVGDLLERRPDADCALFAYAGSAHRVMPLTRDAGLVASFAAAFSPAIMPAAEGDAFADALEQANAELRRAGRSGSIVLISDGVPAGAELDDSVPVHVLGMGVRRAEAGAAAGAPPADFDSLRRVARATGGSFVAVRADAGDVERLAADAEHRIGTTAGDEDGARWKDEGYWLVPVLGLIVLAWSRRGWVISGGAA